MTLQLLKKHLKIMQNILIPIKINGERRRWNGSALSAASGGQPSATQRDIITHLWLEEISLDFLEIFHESVCFDEQNLKTTIGNPTGYFQFHTYGSENEDFSIWIFLQCFEWPSAAHRPEVSSASSIAWFCIYCETGGAKLSPFLWQCGHEMCKWEPVFNTYI